MYNHFIRPGVYGFLSFPLTEDKIEDKIIPDSTYMFFFPPLFILFFTHGFISCFAFIEKDCKYKKFGYFTVVYIVINFIFSFTTIYLSQKDINDYHICNYPFNCEKGINDTILTSNYYYAVPKDTNLYCPTIKYMIDYYNSVNDITDNSCRESEFGCCQVSIRCYIYSSQESSYSVLEYDKKNNIDDKFSNYQYNVKSNQNGTNCPTYKDKDTGGYANGDANIIQEYLEKPYKNDKYFIGIYIISYIFIYVSSYYTCFKEKNKYENVGLGVISSV